MALAIDQSFIDELLKHDFVSSKKGKRLGNILLEKKFKGAKHFLDDDQEEEGAEV